LLIITMKNIKSILVIAALAFVTTTSNVSFANNVNIKKVDECTATVRGIGSDGVWYTTTATRPTCAAAKKAAIAMIP
jgi:hypothetical protein